MQIFYAWRYSQRVSQSPDGCVTTRYPNFTAKAFTWPRVEVSNGCEDTVPLRARKASLCIAS